MTSHHPFVPHQAHEGRGDQKGVDAVHESLKRFESSNNQSAEAVDWDGWDRMGRMDVGFSPCWGGC